MRDAALAKFRTEWRRRRATAFLCVVVVLLVTQWLGPRTHAALRYERPALAAGEWWRLLSAHLVHLDLGHLLMNLAGLLVIWWLYAADARLRDWALVALGSALAIGLGLWFLEPSVLWYVGLSGVLHGLWAGGGVAAFGRWPLESAVTLALLAGKLLLEGMHGALSTGLGSTLPVVTSAHAFGALGGFAVALALRLWRRPL